MMHILYLGKLSIVAKRTKSPDSCTLTEVESLATACLAQLISTTAATLCLHGT